jgi:two-component system, NtrC family, response regulator AtoC
VVSTDSISRTVEETEDFVVGMSPAMQALERVLAEISPTNIPVLVTGESGTGKEMFARRVHRFSLHSKAPLVRIGCVSMNSTTFAAELRLSSSLGTEAAKSSAGTVFLDEISELDAACQRTLLYALPDGEAAPHRGLLAERIVCTTSRNLHEEVHAGRFRSELYYRISGVCLRLPPLRERQEDIPLLTEFFLAKHSEQLGRPRPSLSPQTLRIFVEHNWPGNIRELGNAVKKIVALGSETLTVNELTHRPAEKRAAETSESPGCSLKVAARAASREAERELIIRTLTQTRWNRKRAAQQLQISYKSLLFKLKQIGFERKVG